MGQGLMWAIGSTEIQAPIRAHRDLYDKIAKFIG